MTSLYYSFVHSYLTYENIAWCSTFVPKLKQIVGKQRQAVKVFLFCFSKTTSKSREIMCKVGILNLYKNNIHDVLNFMLRVKS